MNPFILVAVCLVAVIDWLAVWRNWRQVGYAAKPLTILLLLAWFWGNTGLQGPALWFGLGLITSLLGDIFLMLSARFFMAGMISFALTQVFYFIGFLAPFPTISFLNLVILILILLGFSMVILKRILTAQRKRGSKKLMGPTFMYAMLINGMLLSALLSLFRPEWTFGNAILVSLGAVLFYASDLLNAWIRFVNPERKGRTLVMVTYHLGQLLLMLGLAGQFTAVPGV